ncbi:GAF domain-containing sensor histidine kinase [Patulibacter sp. SYSU D01012]|uniref:sensor histidine kinase n=1 Tax=Patulibacter sp. SYSU D01012 TaxID=2817381 RepID=UPI001B30439E|nr:GAF domain-containing sensor histidine kinase [Patulibacter sp. SYSU D01012]
MAVQELDDHRLRRLIAVGRSFVSELDPETLLDEILVAAQELTGARYAALGILDERRELLARFLTRGVDDTTHRAIGDLPHGRGILGVLINEPEPLRLDDLQSHPRSFGFPAGHPPMTTFLGVPIVVRGAAWGNIYLTEKEGGEPFDAADEEALVILADWAAVAVENSNLYARLRSRHDELEQLNEGLAATTAIARAIGAETELERVLELIVKRGRALVDARTMVISLPDGEDLVVAAAAGVSDGAASGKRLPIAGSTQGAVLRDGQPRRVTTQALERDPSTFGIGDARTALLVPLVFRGRNLGVLSAFDRLDSDDGFTPKDEELLRAFAASAATAVATAQTVGEQRLRDALDSAEQERRRWARELHDETLQGLAGLQVRLSTALRQGADAHLADAVHDVLDQVGLEIRKLRTLITELRPAALDELGLQPALESLARDVGATSGLQIDVAIELPGGEGARTLGPESETTVYRLVQEALTNVVKHAEAQRVVVEVRPEDPDLVVAVRDDGRGVDAARLKARAGFGVTGMRERARLAGGELTLEPGATVGTVLRARLPLARLAR